MARARGRRTRELSRDDFECRRQIATRVERGRARARRASARRQEAKGDAMARAKATRRAIVDETRAKLRDVKDASMKRAKPAIERARTTTKRAVEMVKTLDVGARARRALEARYAIGYCVVGILAAAATARSVVGGSAKMNALAAASARCVVETKIGAHRGLAFVDRYFVVLVKHLSARAGALRTTSPSEAKAKAMLDVIIAFASSGAAAMHVKMILITIAFSAIARVVFDTSTRRREVKVVLVTGGSGGLGSLLLEGIRTEFPNAIVYGTSRAGASGKKLGRQIERILRDRDAIEGRDREEERPVSAARRRTRQRGKRRLAPAVNDGSHQRRFYRPMHRVHRRETRKN